MAAPTTAARVKTALANPEPSTHGPILPTLAVREVDSYPVYIGRDAGLDSNTFSRIRDALRGVRPSATFRIS
jgi:hypothetical protein